MIKDLYLEDLSLLLETSSHLKEKVSFLKRRKKNIVIKGYFNNEKLQSFLIYTKLENKINIIYVFSRNKFSLFKMFIGLSIKLSSRFNKLIIPIEYKKYLEIFSKYRLLDIDYVEEKNEIFVLNLNFRSDFLKIHSNFYCNNFFELYEKVKNNISNEIFMEKKKKYINSFYKNKIKLLKELDKNEEFNVVVYRKKKLFNNGEKAYIEKLKENGYIEIPINTKIFTQNSYCILKKSKTKNDKPMCSIVVNTILKFSVKDYKYNNTPWYYRQEKKFISNYISKTYKNCQYDFLDFEGRLFKEDMYIKTLNSIYLNCSILNSIYIDKIKNIYNNFNIGLSFNSLHLRSEIIICKNKTNKDETLKFFKRYFKLLEKNKDVFNFHHDNFVMYFEKVIYSKYLTKKAMIKILNLPFEEIKKFVLIQSKFKNLNISDILIRKKISSCIKRDKNLEEIYNEFLIDKTKKILVKESDEDILNLNNFVNSLNKYARNNSFIDPLYFINVFKKDCMNIVKNKVKSIFEEDKLDNRTKNLGLFVKSLLGSKKEGVEGLIKNPKRLYRDLRKIYNVSDILIGNFPEQYINKILDLIKSRNHPIPKNLLYWSKVERKCSPEFLMAGDITNCCMNFGTQKAIDYALEEGFGIISIYDNDKIISNSVIWIQSEYNYLVLDNIEALQVAIKNKKYVAKEYLKISSYLKNKFNLNNVVQGINYNDILIVDKEVITKKMQINLKQVGFKINKKFYSDANVVYPLNIREYEEIQNMKKCS